MMRAPMAEKCMQQTSLFPNYATVAACMLA
jgi:hypothetical protein